MSEKDKNHSSKTSGKSSNRLLDSCVDAYMELTKNAPSPELFRKWAGISLVAAAMTRRCWIRTEQGIVYPNSMTVLVGAPSSGKGPAIDPVERILRRLDTTHDILHSFESIHLGPGDCTVAGLFDEFLSDGAQKSYTINGKKIQFQSVILIAEELSAMMHNVDAQMMGYLIKFLNCQPHSQRLRSKGETLTVEKPVLHILGGVQPKMLLQLFPEQSFDMGLTARTTFVYSDEKVKISPFSATQTDPELESKLEHDLRLITDLVGQFRFTEDAQQRIENWWLFESDEDRPKHPKLEGYAGKRILHLFRLCMVYSASRADHLVIELEDVENALATLREVEAPMPKIFSSAVGTESAEMIIVEAVHQVEEIFKETKQPVPYHKLSSIVSRRAKPNEVPAIIDLIVKQRLLQEVRIKLPVPGAGPKAYIPRGVDINDVKSGNIPI